MRDPERYTTLAIALSVLLHGGLIYLGSHYANYDFSRFADASPQFDQATPTESHLVIDEPTPSKPRRAIDPIVIRPDEPKPLASLAPAKPLVPEPAPLAKPPEPEPIRPPELMPHDAPPPIQPDGFGELTGSTDATALHSLSGDKPMQARKAENDQPYISRDPIGATRTPADKPAKAGLGKTEKAGEEGEHGSADKGLGNTANPTPTPVPTKPQAPKPTPAPPDPVPAAAAPPKPVPDDARPGPNTLSTDTAAKPTPSPLLAMATPPAEPIKPPQSPSAPSQNSDSKPTGPLAGREDAGSSPNSQADPAPLSDSEMDPFSTVGSAEFRSGKVVARFGRKVKFTRPKLNLAGSYDMISSAPQVVFLIRADETGRVREVKVLKSSGSNEIDQPCMIAIYDWWFEPPKDKEGRPQPSSMVWTITLRTY